MKSLRASLATAAFLAFFLPSATAVAGGLIDVDVISDGGRPFAVYPLAPRERGASRRAYVEALQGARYGIRIRNVTGRRLGLVIAVDGRNIISGSKSYLGRDERMYILGPYESATYSGWRTGRDVVNRFYFTDAGDSYAWAWGDDSAMGVIAVAAYAEKRTPPPPPAILEERDMDRRDGGRAPGRTAPKSLGPSAPGMESRREAPGTGFGEETSSPSVRVAFLPARRPAEKHFLKYEWRETLCRKGIIDCGGRGNRFWDDDPGDYAPYPPYRESRRRS